MAVGCRDLMVEVVREGATGSAGGWKLAGFAGQGDCGVARFSDVHERQESTLESLPSPKAFGILTSVNHMSNWIQDVPVGPFAR